MNKIAVAVCDTDREYRDRFVTYLVERKAEEYAVSAFSMPEKLLEALEEKKPDLAICGTGFEEMAERLAGYDIPVLVLQETMADAVAEPVTYGSVPESCRGICRYQSMEVILHEVQVMTLTGAGSRRMENVGTGMEVIGVYSPICHEMQMPFSMVLAQKLSTISCISGNPETKMQRLSANYTREMWRRSPRQAIPGHMWNPET